MSEAKFKVIVPGIDGGGAQVFEAETPEEMQQQFQQAQENATAKIRELAQQKTALETQMQTVLQAANPGAGPSPSGFDKQQFFNQLYEKPEDAIAYALEKKIGVSLADFMQDYQNTRAGAQLSITNSVSAQFAQNHPELLQVSNQEDDKNNGKVLDEIMKANGWAFNLNNLEAAYAVAKTGNKLKLNETNFAPEVQLPHSPSTISRPTGTINNQASEDEFIRTAPLDKVRKYFEDKYPSGRV